MELDNKKNMILLTKNKIKINLNKIIKLITKFISITAILSYYKSKPNNYNNS